VIYQTRGRNPSLNGAFFAYYRPIDALGELFFSKNTDICHQPSCMGVTQTVATRLHCVGT